MAGYVVEILAHTRPSFLAIICLYTGSRFIELTDRPDHIFNNIVVIALFIQCGLWATVAANGAIARYREKQLSENPASVTTINAIGFVAKLVLWTVLLLLALDNLGIDITALVAGLGIAASPWHLRYKISLATCWLRCPSCSTSPLPSATS